MVNSLNKSDDSFFIIDRIFGKTSRSILIITGVALFIIGLILLLSSSFVLKERIWEEGRLAGVFLIIAGQFFVFCGAMANPVDNKQVVNNKIGITHSINK